MVKLSKVQAEIIRLMREGWELGCDRSWSDYQCWLQKNGLGRGGETKNIRTYRTVFALKDKGLIEITEEGFPFIRYRLTEKGDK